MTIAIVRDFLENSTIHGLVHISTAKSKSARATWVVIVAACFGIAIYMVTDSYKDWQESPVSTTITTHPITELEFPTVTVCPPRGSNTALNHLLERVKEVEFTKESKEDLLGISKEVFLDIPNKKYIKQILEFFSTDHMRSIAAGQASMPEVDEEGAITIRSSEPEGSFKTPGFGDFNYSKDFYKGPQSLHIVLDLADNIGNMVGDGSLIISIETEGNWSFISPENKWQHTQKGGSWYDAEDLCLSLGGHLPSVKSRREWIQLMILGKNNGNNGVWLGGKRNSSDDEWDVLGLSTPESFNFHK